MNIDNDAVAIDDSLNYYSKICKEIGQTEERIEDCNADLYLDQIQGIDYQPLKYSLERLRKCRAELEDEKAKAEKSIYDRFEHYYS